MAIPPAAGFKLHSASGGYWSPSSKVGGRPRTRNLSTAAPDRPARKENLCQLPATETRLDVSRDRTTFFGRSIGLKTCCAMLVSAMSAIALITRASPSAAARRATPTRMSAIARKRYSVCSPALSLACSLLEPDYADRSRIHVGLKAKRPLSKVTVSTLARIRLPGPRSRSRRASLVSKSAQIPNLPSRDRRSRLGGGVSSGGGI